MRQEACPHLVPNYKGGHSHSQRQGCRDRCSLAGVSTSAAQSLVSRMLTHLRIEPSPSIRALSRRLQYRCPHEHGPALDWKHYLYDRDQSLSLAYHMCLWKAEMIMLISFST